MTLQHADHNRLALERASGDQMLSVLGELGPMHVFSLAADKCLVHFDIARERSFVILVHDLADAMEHEPCRLLCDANCAMYLIAGDAVFAVGKHPHRAHPLIKADGRVLEDRSNLERELLLAALA